MANPKNRLRRKNSTERFVLQNHGLQNHGLQNHGLRIHRITLLALLVAALALGGCKNQTSAPALSDKAKLLWEQGEHLDAARTFVALTELYPRHGLVEESLYWAASIYHEYLSDKKQATRYFSQALEQFPAGKYYTPSKESLAQIYEAEKSTRHRALQLYQQLLQGGASTDKRDIYQFKMASLNLQMGKMDQARYEFRNLITQFPGSRYIPEAYYLVGYSYYLEQRYPLAIAVFKRTGLKFSGTMLAQQARFFVADTLEEQGKFREALKVFRSLRDIYYNEQSLAKRIKTLESRIRRSVR